MFKVQIQGGDITSVASLRVLRTLWPLSLKAVEELATALKKQNEFVLVEGVTEIFATELAHEFQSANVVCQILPSEKEEACLCIPIGEPRKRWNALGVLVSR
ncbi:hypothetical protein R6Y90_08490 [Alteromonas macleodii]|uniref:hypothetical protein n=1 Tax=Alteromonas macleodii TaxID=28108 RepID=UPI0029815DD6|nr:hypothetical protein [Alteromonas macleodii]MDW5285006.1 hypothetical protein [Alteromonas macleodii]